jgi:hypothetical protein
LQYSNRQQRGPPRNTNEAEQGINLMHLLPFILMLILTFFSGHHTHEPRMFDLVCCRISEAFYGFSFLEVRWPFLGAFMVFRYCGWQSRTKRLRLMVLQRQTTATPIMRTTANDVPYYVSTGFAEGKHDMRRVEEQVCTCFLSRPAADIEFYLFLATESYLCMK